MELKQYLSTILRWWWLVVLATAIASVSSYMVSRSQPRIYQTTTTLIVGQALKNPETQSYQLYTGQQLATTYAQIATRQPVLEATIDALGLDTSWEGLSEQVSASVIAGTQLLEISVVDTEPELARLLADEVARQVILQSPTPSEKAQAEERAFVASEMAELKANIEQAKADIRDLEKSIADETSARRIQDIQAQVAAKRTQLNLWQTNYANLLTFAQGGTNVLSVVEPARLPRSPISPQTSRDVMLAAAVGIMLSVGAAFLLEYVDDTVKTAEDVQRVFGLAALGTVGRFHSEKERSQALVTARHPTSSFAEAYRVLRTNLQFTSLNNPSGTLLVTSAVEQEGKTTTAANLGVALAQSQKRVILVDSDLRRPTLHQLFGMSNHVGLTNLVLDESLSPDKALVNSEIPGLQILSSGPIPPNSAEILSSPQMRRLVDRLKTQADMVIFDAPPVLALADSAILASQLSAVLLVVNAGRTRTELVRRAVEALERVKARPLGVVLNRMQTRSSSYQYYYRYDRRSSPPEASPLPAKTKMAESAPGALVKSVPSPSQVDQQAGAGGVAAEQGRPGARVVAGLLLPVQNNQKASDALRGTESSHSPTTSGASSSDDRWVTPRRPSG